MPRAPAPQRFQRCETSSADSTLMTNTGLPRVPLTPFSARDRPRPSGHNADSRTRSSPGVCASRSASFTDLHPSNWAILSRVKHPDSAERPTDQQLSWDARLALRMGRLDRRQRPLRPPTRRRIRLAAGAIWLTFSVIWMTAMLWIGGLPPKSPIDPLWQPSMTSGLVYGLLGIAGSAIALAILVPHLIDSTISDEADSDDRDTGR